MVGDILFTEWKKKKKRKTVAYCGHSVGWKEELMQDCILGKARKVWRCEFQNKQKKIQKSLHYWLREDEDCHKAMDTPR